MEIRVMYEASGGQPWWAQWERRLAYTPFRIVKGWKLGGVSLNLENLIT